MDRIVSIKILKGGDFMHKSTKTVQKEFNTLSRKAYRQSKKSFLNKCERTYYKGLRFVNKVLHKYVG